MVWHDNKVIHELLEKITESLSELGLDDYSSASLTTFLADSFARAYARGYSEGYADAEHAERKKTKGT